MAASIGRSDVERMRREGRLVVRRGMERGAEEGLRRRCGEALSPRERVGRKACVFERIEKKEAVLSNEKEG